MGRCQQFRGWQMAQPVERILERALAAEALDGGLFEILAQPLDAGVAQRVGKRKAFG